MAEHEGSHPERQAALIELAERLFASRSSLFHPVPLPAALGKQELSAHEAVWLDRHFRVRLERIG